MISVTIKANYRLTSLLYETYSPGVAPLMIKDLHVAINACLSNNNREGKAKRLPPGLGKIRSSVLPQTTNKFSR